MNLETILQGPAPLDFNNRDFAIEAAEMAEDINFDRDVELSRDHQGNLVVMEGGVPLYHI